MSITRDTESHYIETPRGIFTSAGNWFHVTSESLEKFAPGLLKKLTLTQLIKKSEIWIRSADNLGIVLFMLLLHFQDLMTAAVITMVFIPVWHINKSKFLTLPLTTFLMVIDKEFVVVLVSIFVLSWMGITGHYQSVFIGILAFCFFKFGWFRQLTEWVYGNIMNGALLLNDRVLKMFIIKYAIKEDIPVTEVDAMEKDILSLVNKQIEVFEKYRNRKR